MTTREPPYEERVHRPYHVADILEGLFDDTYLVVGSERCRSGGQLSVDPLVLLRNTIQIEWAPDQPALERFVERIQEGIQHTGLPERSVSLVVLAHASYLKTVALLMELRASDIGNLEFRTTLSDSDKPKRVLQAPFHECEITVALVLTDTVTDLARDVPRDKGYWLVRSVYILGSDQTLSLLQPQPLTDDERDRLDIKKNTISFVELDDEADLLAPIGDRLPTLWIDEEIWLLLDVEGKTKKAEAIVGQLTIGLVRDLIFHFSRLRAGVDSTEADTLDLELIEDSLIGHIIAAAAGPKSSETEHLSLLRTARKRPEVVAARADLALALKKSIVAGLQEA